MIGLIVRLLVSAVIMFGLSTIHPNFRIKNFKASIWVAIVFGLLMAFSGLLVSPLSWLTTSIADLVKGIPIIGTITNIGASILLFLINFCIGAIMLWLTDKFLKDFETNFLMCIVASFLISLINAVLASFI